VATGRFFRQALVQERETPEVAAAVLLQGSAAGEGKSPHRARKVTVLGVEERFWPDDAVPVDKTFWQSDQPEVVLNGALARTLHAKTGDQITLNMQKANNIPRETIFSNRKTEDVLQAVTVKVRLILSEEGMARFTLKPTPEPVHNAFVPLRFLQDKLGLEGR